MKEFKQSKDAQDPQTVKLGDWESQDEPNNQETPVSKKPPACSYLSVNTNITTKKKKRIIMSSLNAKISSLFETSMKDTFPWFYRLMDEPFDASNLSMKQPYTCPYCEKQYPSSCSLGGHISRTHKSVKLTGQKPVGNS